MATATAVKTVERFKPESLRRNKCLAWDAAGNKGKGAGVYTSDLINDDETVNVEAASKWGLKPQEVVFLTVKDLPREYHGDVKQAVIAYAREQEMTQEDAVLDLVLSAMLQKAANKSVAALRPTTDRSKDRALSTLRKVLAEQGKSDAQITAALQALGISG